MTTALKTIAWVLALVVLARFYFVAYSPGAAWAILVFALIGVAAALTRPAAD